jgi:hypothetical protein
LRRAAAISPQDAMKMRYVARAGSRCQSDGLKKAELPVKFSLLSDARHANNASCKNFAK